MAGGAGSGETIWYREFAAHLFWKAPHPGPLGSARFSSGSGVFSLDHKVMRPKYYFLALTSAGRHVFVVLMRIPLIMAKSTRPADLAISSRKLT